MEQEHMEQEEQNIKASEAQEKKEAKEQNSTGEDFPESEPQKQFTDRNFLFSTRLSEYQGRMAN
jgi:hypothetical protein